MELYQLLLEENIVDSDIIMENEGFVVLVLM